MNKPPSLNFFFAGAENAMGSVEAAPIIKVMRPATFALFFIMAAAQAISIVTTGEGGSWLILVLSTGLFAAVHLQFWFEESEQGRKVQVALDRVRGKIYEDDSTGLPNSRHFVFELRRQMMRSVRNGRGFSLALTDLNGLDPREQERALPAVGKALRHASTDGDFIAHLEGPVFAAIIQDDRDRSTTDKADSLLDALASIIPPDRSADVRPLVSLTGYQGELEVRDFLRRAQRDLVGARARGGFGGGAAGRSGRSASAA